MPPSQKPADRPLVTIIVTPRERFGVARQSLDNIYETTPEPFDLIYVDARSPAKLSGWIAEQSQRRGFTHVKLDHFVSPNEARNIGIKLSKTPFVVFYDNDVIATPGWLSPLVQCAEEEGAAVVAPLICEGNPLHKRIHQAGGYFTKDVQGFFSTPKGERDLIDDMLLQGDDLQESQSDLRRAPTQNCEFHCVLARRDLFDQIGLLDEDLLATKEHLDFCMTVAEAGEKVMFEPTSVVTYLFPNRHNPMTREDWPYFLLRWSPIWQHRSMIRMQEKWGLKQDGFMQIRRGMYYWRHIEGIVVPELKRTPLIGRNKLWIKIGKRLFSPVVKLASAIMVRRDDKRRRAQSAGSPQSVMRTDSA